MLACVPRLGQAILCSYWAAYDVTLQRSFRHFTFTTPQHVPVLNFQNFSRYRCDAKGPYHVDIGDMVLLGQRISVLIFMVLALVHICWLLAKTHPHTVPQILSKSGKLWISTVQEISVHTKSRSPVAILPELHSFASAHLLPYLIQRYEYLTKYLIWETSMDIEPTICSPGSTYSVFEMFNFSPYELRWSLHVCVRPFHFIHLYTP